MGAANLGAYAEVLERCDDLALKQEIEPPAAYVPEQSEGNNEKRSQERKRAYENFSAK
jgi:hypothetical protein